MDITGYLKRKMAMLSLAMARVEKSALNQVSDALGEDKSSMEQTLKQGLLADALLKGEITYEVKELRWRMYKVLNATQNLTTKIIGYDEDDLPITETTQHGRQLLREINVDKEDPYDVELVIYNNDIVKSTTEALNNDKITLHEDGAEITKREDRHDLVTKDDDIVVSSDLSLGELSFEDMVATMKSEKNIVIHRNFRPRFEIEQYTNRLVVRNVDGDKKLLEFYISKYPDEFDRKTRLLISEIKKIMKNPRASDIVELERVGFITHKALGAANGMEYIYDIINLHKVIEFNGHYVIKFMAKPIINGEFMYNQHKLEDLEEKYANKAPKNLAK
jgi:DNA-binding transcriptional ArsR family regulator